MEIGIFIKNICLILAPELVLCCPQKRAAFDLLGSVCVSIRGEVSALYIHVLIPVSIVALVRLSKCIINRKM